MRRKSPMEQQQDKKRTSHNRTLQLLPDEEHAYKQKLVRLSAHVPAAAVCNTTINQDMAEALAFLPAALADVLVLDPPYNLTKTFNGMRFPTRSIAAYDQWLESWFPLVLRLLKPTASVYICGDWRTSTSLHRIAERYLVVRNRITWEREKGRGALANWKNCSEDIWFCTASDEYTFNLDAVKLRRRVVAPYVANDGTPKDWQYDGNERYRLTHPSNMWTDLTVPFWSMPENTEHPTQKPEKLLAKILLASSNPGDVVLDPFLGSGTTSVVAKKLGRTYVGIEMDTRYACIAEKRLALAEEYPAIQGYENGVFLERNARKQH